MTQNEKMQLLVSYLESYKFCRTANGLPKSANVDPIITADEAQGRMLDIFTFITGLPEGREKLFLHCHYIAGLSMEQCAEMLGVSIRSIYRIRLRALRQALCRFRPERVTGRAAG